MRGGPVQAAWRQTRKAATHSKIDRHDRGVADICAAGGYGEQGPRRGKTAIREVASPTKQDPRSGRRARQPHRGCPRAGGVSLHGAGPDNRQRDAQRCRCG